jgi:hypothetical protein
MRRWVYKSLVNRYYRGGIHKLFKRNCDFSYMSFAFLTVPNWFLTPDFLISVFSFLVLFIFLVLCIRNYKIDRNKAMLYLGIGFAFIALAQLTILTRKFGLYYNTFFTTYVGTSLVRYDVLTPSDLLYRVGIFFYKALTLVGLYIISRLPSKKKSIKDAFMIIYFIILAVLTSDVVNYLFRITAMALFALLSYNYYTLYRKNKFSNTLILSIAFGILSICQILFMMSQIDIVNIAADCLQLASYIILLVLVIRILKHGTKKEPDGYNLRHAEHHPRTRRKH